MLNSTHPDQAPRYRPYTLRQIDTIPHLDRLPAAAREAIRVVGEVLPFRVNDHVLDHLIDWDAAPDDPMYRLAFPQAEMLEPADYAAVKDLLDRAAPKAELAETVNAIRARLNPHPAGQTQLNVPRLDGRPLEGMQHKYDETVLFFPGKGQTCHAYCSFCYRWPQFIGDKTMRFAARDAEDLCAYLRVHEEVSDLLLTGGDPMVMKAEHMAAYLEPLLAPDLAHVQSIRIGTKALTWWPARFVTDPDADDLLRLIERMNEAGRRVAIMAHFNHWREMESPMVIEAIRRLRDAGAVIRTQAPLLRGVNDDPMVWSEMWRRQVRLGLVPYYMFIARDTGARRYFEVPIGKAWDIYHRAASGTSGLARTARGPSMSATPGKVEVQGTAEIGGEKVFVLRMIQGRDADWTHRPFFAKYDENAAWLDQLAPAFGEERFFYEDALDLTAAFPTGADETAGPARKTA